MDTSSNSTSSSSSINRSDDGYSSSTSQPIRSVEPQTSRSTLKQIFSIKSIIQTSTIAQIYNAVERSTSTPCIIKRSLRSKVMSQEIDFIEQAYQACPEHCLPIIYKQSCKKYVNFAIPKFGMSLYDFMVERNEVLSQEECKVVFRQVVDCLEKLQKNGIFHLDIKEENILICPKTFQVKLIDFGCSVSSEGLHGLNCNGRNGQNKTTSIVGSKEFCSPEIFLGCSSQKSLPKHDVWSLGVTIVSSMTGDTPYESMGALLKGEEEFRLKNGQEADFIFDQELQYLLSCMLEVNPHERISFGELRKTEFFR